MKKSSSFKFGFTLIELIVVVAMVAILSSVILIGLSRSRADAKIASAQSTMVSILPIANSCLDGTEVLLPMDNAQTGGGEICEDIETNWPELTGGWEYDTNPTSNTVSHSFTYSASDGNGNSITCTAASGCVVTLEE